MAKTFYLTMDIDMQVEIPIQADTLEQAIKKAKNDDYELPNLNDGSIAETRMVSMSDENYNVVEEFDD